jgi:pyridoxal phosphate enzyme (YggS family)
MAAHSDEIGDALAVIRSRIDGAAKRAGRSANDIKLIAVSKTHPAEVVRAAIAAGATEFGENRVQEADSKIAEVGAADVRWHLIGHLQANKARRAAQIFDTIHSIDDVELTKRLDRICGEIDRQPLEVLIQVDLAGEETKSGAPESEVNRIADTIGSCNNVKLVGLMVLPPFFEDPERTRPYFQRLRELRDQLSNQRLFASGAGELSMGMSHDFETAIEEGATMVRVGTAIFGERTRAVRPQA